MTTIGPGPNGLTRRAFAATLAFVPALSALAVPEIASAEAGSDPLPSWTEGQTKKAILTFVERVTKEGSPEDALAGWCRRDTTGW